MAMHCDVLDVLIVGGGPAGLAAGIALRQKGIDVLVVDALHPPIDKACGEGLMPDSLDVLARLGIAIPEGSGARFDGIAFLSARTRAAARFPHGPGIGIRRTDLHALLVRRANEIGVRTAWGTRVTLIRGQPARINGSAYGSECRYRLLLGADGQQSLVRRWSGLDAGSSVIRRYGRRRHFLLPAENRNAMVEVYWGRSGQAYVTPVAIDRIGVATVSRSPRLGMEQILNDLPRLKRKLQGASVCGSMRGSITTTRRLRHVVRGNVALIGDASGSADAVTGEGLALAFRQALLLAEAVAADDLGIYDAGHPAILRQPRAMARAMLAMDRLPWLRNRALHVLASDANLFPRLLALHIGEKSSASLGPKDGWRIGLRLLRSFAQPI